MKTKTKKTDSVHCVELGIDTTLDDLVVQMKKMKKSQELGMFVCCGIAVDGNDPRELYEIPEVRKFCQRLFDTGFAALLSASALVPEMNTVQGPFFVKHSYGSLEVWLVAKNLLKVGHQKIPLEQLEQFEQDLLAASQAASELGV